MIRFGFYTPAVVLSSDLPDITIFTDHEFVDFRLLAGGNPLLQGRYYALNDTTVVSDISKKVALKLTTTSFVFKLPLFVMDKDVIRFRHSISEMLRTTCSADV